MDCTRYTKTNYHDYNNHENLKFKKFKKLFIGTAPLINLKVELKKYKLKIIENYGLTETLWLSCAITKERNNLNVGKLFDGVEIKNKKIKLIYMAKYWLK